VLQPGIEFLPKPYTPSALARRVRALLDKPDAPIPGAPPESFGFGA
jgi:DNA-binding response OmpR family regulator